MKKTLLTNTNGRSLVTITGSNRKTQSRNENLYSKSEMRILKNEIEEIKEKLIFKNRIKGKEKEIFQLKEIVNLKNNQIKKLNETLINSNSALCIENSNKNQVHSEYNKSIYDLVDEKSLVNHELKELLSNLQQLIPEIISNQTENKSKIKSEVVSFQNKILKILLQINEIFENEKEFHSILKEKDRTISILKRENHEMREKEKKLTTQNQELYNEIRKLNDQIGKIGFNNKDSVKEKINQEHELNIKASSGNNKKVIFSNLISNKQHTQNHTLMPNMTFTNFNNQLTNDQQLKDSFLIRENADLKKRLEKSYVFIMKKREKIIKLTEKINDLQEKINNLTNNKNTSLGGMLNQENNKNQVKIKEIMSNFTKFYNYSNNSIENSNHIKDLFSLSINFKIDRLKFHYKELMNEIIDNGTYQFTHHFFSVSKSEQESLIGFVTDQMLIYIDFSKRLNSIISILTYSVDLSIDSIIKNISTCLNEIFGCERSCLWVYNQKNTEYQTIINGEYTSFPMNDYFLNVQKIRLYNKRKLSIDEIDDNKENERNNEIYPSKIQFQFSSSSVNSVLSVSIQNSKSEIQGILELINSKNLIFGYDEEYLLILLSKYISILIESKVKLEKSNYSKETTINSFIINTFKSRTMLSLQSSIQAELIKFLPARQVKVMFFNKNNGFYLFQNKDNTGKDKAFLGLGGIALWSTNFMNGVFCKAPNVDIHYNPNIDIAFQFPEEKGIFSIPLRNNNSLYALIQYTEYLDDCTIYKSGLSCEPSKFDIQKESMVEMINEVLISAINGIDNLFFA